MRGLEDHTGEEGSYFRDGGSERGEEGQAAIAGLGLVSFRLLPKPQRGSTVSQGLFPKERFRYDGGEDIYEVFLGMGACDRAPSAPEAFDGGGGIITAGCRSGPAAGSRHGQERARLGKGFAKALRAGPVLDEVQEVAVVAGGAVGPFATCRRRPCASCRTFRANRTIPGSFRERSWART